MSLKDKVKSAAEMVGETTAAAAAAAAVEDHDMTEGEGQEAEDMLTVVRLSRKTGKPKWKEGHLRKFLQPTDDVKETVKKLEAGEIDSSE